MRQSRSCPHPSSIDCEQEEEEEQLDEDGDCYIDKIQSLVNFCVADGWKVHELTSIMKNLGLPSEKTDDLLVTATAAISLVEQMEADIMDFEKENSPSKRLLHHSKQRQQHQQWR